MKISPDTPTGQYDSCLPSLLSSEFVSRSRDHVAANGSLNLGRAWSTPVESYITGALFAGGKHWLQEGKVGGLYLRPLL